MKGHVVGNVLIIIVDSGSADQTMILQMPVDKSSPEVGSNLSWQQQTLLGGTQQQITELCNGVPPYVVKNEETDMCILVLTFLLLWLRYRHKQ